MSVLKKALSEQSFVCVVEFVPKLSSQRFASFDPDGRLGHSDMHYTQQQCWQLSLDFSHDQIMRCPPVSDCLLLAVRVAGF